MRAFVGVTDRRWYEYLRARPWIDEVNFWNPGGVAFKALQVGEPFLFKSHHPHNRLVGGGFFSGFASLRLSEAWRIFGEGNGVESLDEMRSSIARYRREPIGSTDDPVIGCTIIRDVVLAKDADLLDPPPDFAKNIVRGKGYEVEVGTSFVEEAFAALLAQDAGTTGLVPGPVFGDGRLVANRLGQRAFKALILTAYQRRCAVTGTRIVPALHAAHIRPVTQAGENRTDNGLLLRSDVHTMFDNGYLGIDPAHRLHVSPRLRSEFGNGDWFYAHRGDVIDLPSRRSDRPARTALEWHMDAVFLAS